MASLVFCRLAYENHDGREHYISDSVLGNNVMIEKCYENA